MKKKFWVPLFLLTLCLGCFNIMSPKELKIVMQDNWIAEFDVRVCMEWDEKIWDSGLKDSLINKYDEIDQKNIDDFYRYFYTEVIDGKEKVVYGILIKKTSKLKYDKEMFEFIENYTKDYFEKNT